MRMNIQWRNVAGLSEPDRQAIERRLEALAAEHGDLIDVQIAAKPTQHHRHGGQEVRVSGHARGRDLVATRVRDDLAQALAEVLDAFEREVRKLRERRTDERTARVTEPPVLGVIDRVLTDRGYGFILTDAGQSVYFHRNAVHGGLAFERLEEGQRVGLNVEPGQDGPQATVVVPPPPDAPSP
jgi:cold shock CspA family protein/ribosome-associated translation inhibitor RaiA